jgi:tRNA pseudouridine55 synthase
MRERRWQQQMEQHTELEGILAVWKPAGWTSHDVVAKVRRLTRMRRIGHAGTLDPQVTGVLPLCLGRATRAVEYLQEMPKAYEAVMRLGVATDTEDMTGTVVETADASRVTEAMVRDALARFIGEIEQVPPMYSAVKVGGRKLYELAREGKTVEREARKVTIHSLELKFAELGGTEPRIGFAAVCSKGTYIRTLCVDIGRALGVPAAMESLVRTMSAGLGQADCLTIERIEALAASGGLAGALLPVDRALGAIPRVEVGAAAAARAARGQRIRLPAGQASGLVRLYGAGRFVGLFEADGEAGALKPVKVFASAEVF